MHHGWRRLCNHWRCLAGFFLVYGHVTVRSVDDTVLTSDSCDANRVRASLVWAWDRPDLRHRPYLHERDHHSENRTRSTSGHPVHIPHQWSCAGLLGILVRAARTKLQLTSRRWTSALHALTVRSPGASRLPCSLSSVYCLSSGSSCSRTLHATTT